MAGHLPGRNTERQVTYCRHSELALFPAFSELINKGTATNKPTEVDSGKPVRVSAASLNKHRERLGPSAPMLATILGVSAQTIYNWESATSRPSKDQVVKIAILRKMGKREVQQRLAQMRAA